MDSPDEFSIAVPTDVSGQLQRHLLRHEGQEDLTFVTWRPSTGLRRTTALLGTVVLPEPGDRHVHGNAAFTAGYFLRAADVAAEAQAGLGLIHSHPNSNAWQHLSDADAAAERNHAGQTQAITGFPLVGMTMNSRGAISGRIWERTAPRHHEPLWARNTRSVGRRFEVAFDDHATPPPNLAATHPRTISAWGGELQKDLTRLRVGIIGLGSVGMLIAESLARAGVGHLLLMDFDTIKRHNLDRTLHATWLDVALRRSKVEVARRELLRSRPSDHTTIETSEFSIVEEDGLLRALDCDVIFCCVDRPWPRNVLNRTAYAHLIPVVDGGIDIPARGPRWMGPAAITSYIAAPGRRCMACMAQYSPSNVAMEQDGSLDDPAYLANLHPDHVLKSRQNVFAFAAQDAALEVLQFVAMFAGPDPQFGPQRYSFSTGAVETLDDGCDSFCDYPAQTGQGDLAPAGTVAIHDVARLERRSRSNLPWRIRVLRSTDTALRAVHRHLARRVTVKQETE